MSQNTVRKSLAHAITRPSTFPVLVAPLRARWDRCFDYLRQTLACAADVTLEDVTIKDGDDDNEDGDGDAGAPMLLMAEVEGWHATHDCRDYQALYNWAAEHRAAAGERTG